MNTRASALLLLAACAPLAAQEPAPKPAAAQTATGVRDAASLFGIDAVLKAGAAISACERARGVPIMVETIESTEGDEPAEVARRRSRGSGGVYVLIVKDKHHIEGPLFAPAINARLDARRAPIRQAFIDHFKQNDYDGGLLKGVDAIVEALGGTEPDTPLIARNQVRLTLAGARKAIEAAEAKATSMKASLAIAVVDDGGHLLAFARMDGASTAAATAAETVATEAAQGLRALVRTADKSPAAADGTPMVVDGRTIGAIGVAGGTDEQAREAARAALDAFTRALRPAEPTRR